MTSDIHKPLRDDVRLLGELLGKTLKAREGEELFLTVERVRALAKSAPRRRARGFRARWRARSAACRSTRRCRSRARSRNS